MLRHVRFLVAEVLRWAADRIDTHVRNDLLAEMGISPEAFEQQMGDVAPGPDEPPGEVATLTTTGLGMLVDHHPAIEMSDEERTARLAQRALNRLNERRNLALDARRGHR
jgi:hypothetical protein